MKADHTLAPGAEPDSPSRGGWCVGCRWRYIAGLLALR